MQSNPYEPPSAPLVETRRTLSQGQVLSIALVVTGTAAVTFWGYHLWWQLQPFVFYAEPVNYWVGPVSRATINLPAMAAGVLMIVRSRWLWIPFAIHCIAFVSKLLSFAGTHASGASFPVDTLLLAIAELMATAVVLAWYVKGKGR